MANYSIWILEEGNITISGGQQLDGLTQGEGTHLLGQTIRLDSADWLEVAIDDNGPDNTFDDQDTNQRLDGDQTIDGVLYSDRTVVEAEYTLTLRDPDTGIEYTAVGFNVNNSSPSFATVEGLSFIGPRGGFPPIGVDLEVVAADEGPGAFGNPAQQAGNYAFPICFTPGTAITTAAGPRPVETLKPGDLVLTRDHGLRPIAWIGRSEVTSAQLIEKPQFRPVRIAKGAFGPDQPNGDLVVSQQHRVLLSGWRAELLTGTPEVLAPACHLVDGRHIRIDRAETGVTYIHIMFDRHEVITANGLATESFFPGEQGMGVLDPAARREVLTLFPELAGPNHWSATRPAIRRWESALICA